MLIFILRPTADICSKVSWCSLGFCNTGSKKIIPEFSCFFNWYSSMPGTNNHSYHPIIIFLLLELADLLGGAEDGGGEVKRDHIIT